MYIKQGLGSAINWICILAHQQNRLGGVAPLEKVSRGIQECTEEWATTDLVYPEVLGMPIRQSILSTKSSLNWK